MQHADLWWCRLCYCVSGPEVCWNIRNHVVGDATDFCIIMQALFTIDSTSIQRQRQDDSRGTWIIQRAKAKLREQVCQHLLFVHTILGCDTTSSLFGFRKAILLKLIQTSRTFIEQGSNIQPRGVVISRKRQLCAYTSGFVLWIIWSTRSSVILYRQAGGQFSLNSCQPCFSPTFNMEEQKTWPWELGLQIVDVIVQIWQSQNFQASYFQWWSQIFG